MINQTIYLSKVIIVLPLKIGNVKRSKIEREKKRTEKGEKEERDSCRR